MSEIWDEPPKSTTNIDNISKIVSADTTAIIQIKPEANIDVIRLKKEIAKLREYAVARVIKTDADISPANDDISLISNLKKALKAKQDEYIKPIKSHLADTQTVFKELTDLLEEADSVNRWKVTAYRNEQKRRQTEAEELNRQAEELARKQAEFSGTGEYTIDTTPIEAAPVINKVSTNMGTLSFKDNWTWELEDIAKVPEEYKILDRGMVTRRVKSGERHISGIRIFKEEVLRNKAK